MNRSKRVIRSAFPGGALALILLPLAGESQQRRPLDLEDYYRIERPSGVAISPDGEWVAYAKTRVLEAENRSQSEIWLVLSDGGGEPFRITSPAVSASGPRWSPNGGLLAFSSSRTVPGEDADAGSTWFLRMDGRPGEAFRIEGVGESPIFDPTGALLAFTKAVPPSGSPPSAGGVDSEVEQRIVERFDGRIYDWMNYRFDRRGYLSDPRDPWATPPRQLFVVGAEGGEPVRLTSLDVDVGSPAWRPDGGALVFVADAHQRDEHSYERADLWTVDLDGSVTRLTDDELNYGSPSWSPDGRSVVARGNVGLDVVIRERWDHGAPTDLFLFRVAGEGGVDLGQGARNLTEEWDLIPGSPAWSPDGRWIYFTAGIRGDSHLFRVSMEGREVEQVTQGTGRIGGVSFSGDFSRFAYDFQTPTDPGNVFVRDIGGSPARLTRLNAELLAELELETPEVIRFRSADGTEVEGWVLPPVGAERARGPAPMILTIHGGPHGAYGNTFAFDRHLMSGRGYYVLFTNPRASTGYGEAFRWGTWGSWGDEDYDDVMAGVDHALASYPIDPERMAVTGYSYGGYLTNWVITQTDRFRAAVAGASISNWVSDYGTADIPRTKESEFFGPPWEEEGLANLMAASPIVHAGGVTTPTLFIHGETDHRVPIEEAEQMYTALRKQQVPAKFIRYPDSYHGGWTPWRYLHRLWSTVEWMDEWVRERPVS